jgi:hypothetical protein
MVREQQTIKSPNRGHRPDEHVIIGFSEVKLPRDGRPCAPDAIDKATEPVRAIEAAAEQRPGTEKKEITMLRRRPVERMAVDTAIVAGTAGAVAGHRANKQQQQAEAQAPPEAPEEAPPATEDTYAELERLGQLHAEGVLTDEEFAAQKAKILG